MPRTIGKAFKIAKKDVKSYGYASPNRGGRGRMTPNAGVTAIAAINGPGAHARHHRGVSARAAMNGLSREERLARARRITGADRAAFARRMGAATKSRGTTMRTNASAAQIAAARRNIKKAIAARRSGSHRANRRPGRSRLRLNPWRRETERHSHAALRGWYTPPPYASTAGTAAKRRAGKKHKANKRKHKANGRRKTMRTHRRNFSAKQRAAALRNLKKARAARKHSPNARRRTAKAHRANPVRRRKAHRRNPARKRSTRRTHRRNFTAKQRAAALRNLAKARRARKHSPNARRRTRKHRRNGHVGNRRRTARRGHRRNFTAKQRAAALRNLAKARRARKHSPNARRRTRKGHRRNGMALNKHRRSRKAHRRNSGHRRNGRKAFRRNQYLATLKEVLKLGAITTAGFIAHKAVTKVFTDQILDRILGSSGAVTPAAPAAASGLEGLQPYRSIIGGAAVAAAGVFLANKVIKDAQVKMFVTAGMATLLVHSIAVVALAKLAPRYTGYLSGDATAAHISAMFGFGGGASIMPQYHPLSMGEYFAQNGLGEYFAQNGLGEYFAQNGLGAYTSNPDLMQAAAGYGEVEDQNSNIVDPGSDLDEQLSIAEAAAGVGAAPFEAAAGYGASPFEAAAGFGAIRRQQPFEAQAGMGEFFAQSGLGAIATVPPTADTWIPGSSHGALWAGTRSIARGQSANSMTSAGILETDGNQGVFG